MTSLDMLDADQLANGQIIVRTVIDLGGRWWDCVCAVACALQESSLRNLPGGDKDSVGLFQQRPSQGWGTPEQCQDPVYATTAFCVGTPDTAHGLFGISNRYNLPLTVAVQEVQLSANPDAYAKWQTLASQVATADTQGAEVIGPPVSIEWIPAYSYTPGRPEGLDFIVVHDVECDLAAGKAHDVAVNWFATPQAGTSAHAIVGPDVIVEMVKPMDTAWHCANGNQRGYGIEQTGWASYTRGQWTTAVAMLQMNNYAWWCAHIARQFGIPARWLTDSELATPGQKGFCTHADVTRVLGGTTHTDPGTGYPRDLLIAAVAANLSGAVQGEDMTPDQDAMLKQVNARLGLVLQALALNNVKTATDKLAMPTTPYTIWNRLGALDTDIKAAQKAILTDASSGRTWMKSAFAVIQDGVNRVATKLGA